MECEVRSCEVGRMYSSGAGAKFNPKRHRVIECDWIKVARRQTGRKDLFLYRHLRTGKFMLAYWVARPGRGEGPGYFMDLEDMDGHPDRLTGRDGQCGRLGMALVRARLRPVDEMMRDHERKMAAVAYEEMMAEEESAAERKDAASYLERKKPWMDRAVWGIRTGESGYVGEREGGEHLKNLIELLKGR